VDEDEGMDVSHDTLVALSKSWGLFYLIAFAVVVLVYTLWPGNRARFDAAKKGILDQDDKPWR
jgi:cytochrome c oxidase cbb3-type subunit 4